MTGRSDDNVAKSLVDQFRPTLNDGVRLSRCDLTMFLNSSAGPVNSQAVDGLVGSQANCDRAGVGRQIPRIASHDVGRPSSSRLHLNQGSLRRTTALRANEMQLNSASDRK